MNEMVRRFFTEETGQGMTEYALILALVSIVAIGALILMGEQISVKFNEIVSGLGGTPAE